MNIEINILLMITKYSFDEIIKCQNHIMECNKEIKLEIDEEISLNMDDEKIPNLQLISCAGCHRCRVLHGETRCSVCDKGGCNTCYNGQQNRVIRTWKCILCRSETNLCDQCDGLSLSSIYCERCNK